MYHHCKATEDKDMSSIDFLTDHLLNIDGIFDKHDNGDEQKPHQTPSSQHHVQSNLYFANFNSFSLNRYNRPILKHPICDVKFIPYKYINKFFHPPNC